MSAFLYSSSTPDDCETQSPFGLVVAYQDSATREQAARLCTRLQEQVRGEYNFQSTWWSLEDLADPSLRHEAATSAAHADMIILSLSTGQALPANTNPWIESWVSQKEDRKSALVALINKHPPLPQTVWPVRSYLQTVAHEARMDFFFHAAESTPDLPYSLHAIHQRAELITPVLQESLTPRFHNPRVSF
jgi:hypothetical protein